MKTTIRKISAMLFIFTLSAALCLSAAAELVDFGYSGIIDSYTGQAAASSSGGTVGTDQVMLGDCRYDREAYCFVYPLTGGEVRSTVVSGMVTNQPVSISLPSGMDATLYRNGSPVDAPDLSHIAQAGSYVLAVQEGARQSQPLKFTVVGETAGNLEYYNMPEYFSISEVTLDDQPVAFSSTSVALDAEGSYLIKYGCPRTGINYELRLLVDHTPPSLALEAVTDGVAKGPVDLSDLEQGAAMLIRHDGKVINNVTRLTESGSYTVMVQDAAGNTATYQFRIQVYFNNSSLWFFALVVVFIGGVALYVWLSRNRLRVR